MPYSGMKSWASCGTALVAGAVGVVAMGSGPFVLRSDRLGGGAHGEALVGELLGGGERVDVVRGGPAEDLAQRPGDAEHALACSVGVVALELAHDVDEPAGVRDE